MRQLVLSPRVCDHVPRHGLVCALSCLAQSSSGLPQLDEASESNGERRRESRSTNWSGLVWSSLAVGCAV